MKRELIISAILVFILAATIFGYILYLPIETDIQFHAKILREIIEGQRNLSPNFLYYLFLYGFSFFRIDQNSLILASLWVLSLAVVAKFLVTQKFMVTFAGNLGIIPFTADKKPAMQLSLLMSTLLIFLFSVPFTVLIGGYFYTTNFPPNVWHNPTTILLMPFALLLFWLSYQQLKAPTTKRVLLITLLCVLNILIKPSFFFCFCVVFPLFLLWQYRLGKYFLINLVPVVVGLALVAVEYYWIYLTEGSEGGVIFSPLTVWAHYSPNIPLSILGSIFFPFLFICFYWEDLKKNMLFNYGGALLLSAILIFGFLSETGYRQFHANFSWQYIISNYVFYMVVTTIFIQKILESQRETPSNLLKLIAGTNWKNKILLVVFGFQFLLGSYYIFRMILTRDYHY